MVTQDQAGVPAVSAVVAAGANRGLVELRGVTKRFGSFTAVDRLDLSVSPGEFISLLGPSGCGKTTTLRMLAGFEHPDEGAIAISGTPVLDLPPHRRDVNTVFQAYALFPHMTVAENIAYGLRQRKVARADLVRRVGDALDMVKMTPFAGRRPRQLSGGQQQRVALARALVNRPSVLLLDEPLAALDRKLREEMQIELKLLQSQLGITFVFVTHDQSEALSMSDRIAVMLEGRIEQLADPYTVYDKPASAFVAGFIGQQNFFKAVAGDSASTADGTEGRFATARPVPSVSTGQSVLVAVRPESVTVSGSHPGDLPNVVGGVLASISHLGDVIQHVVTLAGRELIARFPRAQAPRLRVGDQVWCSWSPDDTLLFTDEQAHLVLAEPALRVEEAPD